MFPRNHVRTGYRMLAVSAVSALALSACGGSSSPSAPTAAGGAASSAPTAAGAAGGSTSSGASGQVLPVKTNPIKNTSTAQTLKITGVMVENNVDPSTKKAVPDHLEIALKNDGSAALSGFEVYYTFTDKVTKATESYYTKLPVSFTIPAGGATVINFDNSGQPNHFPVNKFDLYHTSKNALTVAVEVSAAGAAPQTSTVDKAAGGAETAD